MKTLEKFIKYLARTFKNKIYATILIIVGYLSMLPENDGTIFIFTLMIGIPLFFAPSNYIN